MPTLNPFSDGGVTLDGYTGGAFKDSKGFSGHQPFPIFSDWDATASPPDGMGSDQARVRFAWAHGSYLYLWVDSTDTSECGIYRRSVVGSPPTHTTDQGFCSTQTLFGNADRAGVAIFDDTNGLIYLTRFDGSTSLVGVIGCWDMDDYPFSQGNAQWITTDTSVGSRVAGKVSRYIWDLQLNAARTKLYATAFWSGSVFTINTSDGSLAGEWAYNTNYNEDYNFALLGHDDSNDYVIGGAYPATAGDGDICTWDTSTPTSWTKVAIVIEGVQYATHRSAVHNGVPWELRKPSLYWLARYLGFTPRQLELAGIDNNWFAYQLYTFYTDVWGLANYLVKKDGTEYHRLSPPNTGSLGGLTGFASVNVNPIVANPGGVAYYVGTAAGTPRNNDVAGTNDEEGCPYLQCVDHPSYRFTYTLTGPTTLKRILIDLDATAVNRECSRNPGKHRFRIEKKPSGGSWGSPSEWRAGAALLHLDEEYDGDPAWPSFDDGDQLRITHEMTSGFFDNFEAVEAAAGCEKSGTNLPIGALADIGMPAEVLPLVDYDASLPDVGKTYGTPISVGANIIKPQSVSAEITS